jgi:hypothetical protein
VQPDISCYLGKPPVIVDLQCGTRVSSSPSQNRAFEDLQMALGAKDRIEPANAILVKCVDEYKESARIAGVI